MGIGGQKMITVLFRSFGAVLGCVNGFDEGWAYPDLDPSLGVLVASSMILDLIKRGDVLSRVMRRFLDNF